MTDGLVCSSVHELDDPGDTFPPSVADQPAAPAIMLILPEGYSRSLVAFLVFHRTDWVIPRAGVNVTRTREPSAPPHLIPPASDRC